MEPEAAVVVPAPWRLEGRGYVLFYWFPPDLPSRHLHAEGGRGRFQGGPGAVLLVDYRDSPVGPYRELLFLGRFEVAGAIRFCIPRILVSSASSARGGRENWGLPKEVADFEWTQEGPRRERVRVRREGRVFFDAALAHGRVPVPLLAARWPVPITLAQPWQGRTLFTSLLGVGLARRARLVSLRVDAQLFPDPSPARPVLGLEIEPFRLTFPAPRAEGAAAVP